MSSSERNTKRHLSRFTSERNLHTKNLLFFICSFCSCCCHYRRLEMIESNYFIKLMCVDFSWWRPPFPRIPYEMKNTWNIKERMKKKKLLVEWKIGTFGVYNLTSATTTTTKARTVEEKPQSEELRGPKSRAIERNDEIQPWM